ncbi:hypothetical protein DRQ18_07185 [bacterium]|nr:MAG: hypothetical protein DRQ18_07185 [bacterium]
MRNLLPLIFLFFALSLNAQQYVLVRADTLDFTSGDYARDVAIDGKGNVYVVGEIKEATLDFIIIGCDSLGNIIWADTVDHGNSDYGVSVAVDEDRNVYVLGEAYISTRWHYFIGKYDSLGNLLWMDTLGDAGTAVNEGGITIDRRKNVYAAMCYGGTDYFVVKYDSVGNMVWADTLDVGGVDRASGVVVDSDFNVYVTGYTNTLDPYNDFYTVKYDSLGNLEWGIYGGGRKAHEIALDSKRNLYVAGEGTGSTFYSYSFYTMSYDSAGNERWTTVIYSDSGAGAWDVDVDEFCNVYVTGYMYDEEDNAHCLVVRYDSLGNIIWADTLDIGDQSWGSGIAVDTKGNVYVALTFYDAWNGNILILKYSRFKDIEMLHIASPDTVSCNNAYTPRVWVRNNSYELTLDFDVECSIDSSGYVLYADTQQISGLPSGDSVLVEFSPWNAPSLPCSLKLTFRLLTPDMDSLDNLISRPLAVMERIPPIIDSAVASDGVNPLPGIDNDDYVALYFSEPTTKPVIDASNIDSVLSLSGGHSWLDGFGSVGECMWNQEGTILVIYLTTTFSPPTISPGDTIIPDGKTIRDLYDNPCSSPVVLTGSFGPQEVSVSRRDELEVMSLNHGGISFTCTVKDEGVVALYGVDGRLLWKKEVKGTYKGRIRNIPSGVYFLRLEEGNRVVKKKVMVME